MKRLLACFLIICLMLSLAACKEDEPSLVPLDLDATLAPESSDPAEDADPSASPASERSYGTNAAVSVTGTAAYVFEDADGVKLYGAAAYTNTGDCPLTIGSATFTFTAGGQTVTHEFVPPLGEFAVLLPGETSFVTAWLTPAAEAALAPGAEAALSASLSPVRAAEECISLAVDDLYVADNYPNFSTLSGQIACEGLYGCSMNVIHVGFYDEGGSFLGAWYFTKNALLEGGETKRFVAQMHGLPIPSLAERAAEIHAVGFGFDL